MGKTFVMADRRSAVGYFEDGREGFVVEAGDVEGLRDCMKRLLEDRDLLATMSARAKELIHRKEYTTVCYMQSVYNAAIEIDCERRGSDPSARLIDLY
jgi:hypothetical protein